MGHEVTSRWLDVSPGFEINATVMNEAPDRGRRYAERDMEDIQAADMVISFTDGELARGGRHAEFGMAVAWEKTLVLVGPREQLFHTLGEVRVFATWEDFLVDMLRSAA